MVSGKPANIHQSTDIIGNDLFLGGDSILRKLFEKIKWIVKITIKFETFAPATSFYCSISMRYLIFSNG